MEPLPVQSLAELQRELRPLEHRSYTFTNWATTFSSRTRAAYAPETVHHVRQIVQLARRTKRELRAVGSGHSPSDLVCTEGYLLRMDRMQRLLSVTDDGRVTVQAGIKLTKLHELLAPHGLAVSSLGSISDQSLSGAISTATHGSGVTFGNLSTFITALTLVLPDLASTVLTITADSHPDHFQAALCGLGTLGIIVEMEIQCEPTFKLEEETWCISIADFRRDWKRLAESGEHVRCWWFPQVGEVKISRMNRTTKPITPRPSFLYSFLFDRLLSHDFHKLALSVSRFLPSILPYHAQIMYHLVHRVGPIQWRQIFAPAFPQLSQDKIAELDAASVAAEDAKLGPGQVFSSNPITPIDYRTDLSQNIFNYDCGFPQYTYEGSVPYAETGATLAELEQFFVGELWSGKWGKDALRNHFPVEIRFTEADDIWLSPTQGGRGTYIGIIQYRPFNLPVPYRALFSAFESILLRNTGRPHWAKSHNCSPAQLASMYPRFGDFLALREKVDPDRVLCNPYVRRHLLGEIGEALDMRAFKVGGKR